MLGRRRARIMSEEMREGADVFAVHSFLPAEASFGLMTEMRQRSSGGASASLLLSHWERLQVINCSSNISGRRGAAFLVEFRADLRLGRCGSSSSGASASLLLGHCQRLQATELRHLFTRGKDDQWTQTSGCFDGC